MTTPKPTNVLAIALYLQAQITEGRLAQKLGCDRLEARQRVADFLNTAIANASVPIERIQTLEQRLATAHAQVARLQLEIAELQQDLAAERHRLADLAHEKGVPMD
ncbi:MAG: hypothetical protein BroJett011_04450 [Chloroflexota bacterium]|nr:MAG: hypothetical protein BroJett011_04450 [Chloroflexota bacterium]